MSPYSGLIRGRDGNFYGTTAGGGLYGWGTVFKLDQSGTLTTLHAFNRDDGARPVPELVQASDGTLYGTTSRGGAFDRGTVFRIGSGAFLSLYSFGAAATDGSYPNGPLVQASDGNLYGTTFMGGCSDSGTVFKIDSRGALATIHTFSGADGEEPEAGRLGVIRTPPSGQAAAGAVIPRR